MIIGRAYKLLTCPNFSDSREEKKPRRRKKMRRFFGLRSSEFCFQHQEICSQLNFVLYEYFIFWGGFFFKLELGLAVVDSSRNLDDLGGAVVTGVDAFLDRLIKDVLGEETTNEGVTSTVGVDNKGLLDLVDGVLSHLKGK